jgi:hypothetical protein
MKSVSSILWRCGAIGGAAAALFVAGCASSDLSQETNTTSEVVECLPTDAPSPSLVARAIWYPKASGFGSTDATPLGHVTGVLALAGDKLYFMWWNAPERHYDVYTTVDLMKAARISVARLGPSAMLVIESRNLSFDSFELMKGGHFLPDPQGTQDLFDKLQVLRAKNPQQDP